MLYGENGRKIKKKVLLVLLQIMDKGSSDIK